MKSIRQSLATIFLFLLVLTCASCRKKSEAPTYEKGTLTDSTFKSAFLDLQFQLPEGYVMQSEDVLMKFMSAAADTVYEDESKTVIDYVKTKCVIELYAIEETDGTSVNITVEKDIPDSMDEKGYLDLSKAQIERTHTNYTIDDTYETVTLAGHEYLQLYALASVNGDTIVDKLLCRKIGSCIVNITFGYLEGAESSFETLYNGFSLYSE